MPDHFAANWTYLLPFQAHGVAMRQLIEGWQFNGILNAFDGLPFAVTSATNTLNTEGTTKAQLIGPGNGALRENQRTMQRSFNTAAFTATGPQQYGNATRDTLEDPGTKELDFSFFKDFMLQPEAVRNLRFRAEYFNITNTPQFNNPTSSVGAEGAGTITSAGAPYQLRRLSREIQLGPNECSDRNAVEVFAWIDNWVQDSTNASSLNLHSPHFPSRRHL